MKFIDYTHPDRIPQQPMPFDRRSGQYYLRLDELPPEHSMYSPDWPLFRHPEWLEGGSAWIQAGAIARDVEQLAAQNHLEMDELRPIIGSQDPAFDEALAQGLQILGLRPLISEFGPRTATPTRAQA